MYHSNYPLVRIITLMTLNNLADEPHNALCRLFASIEKEKMKALAWLLHKGVTPLPETVKLFLTGVADFLFRKGGADMKELTSEEKAMFTRVFHNIVIPNMPAEEVLKGIPVEKVLKGIPVEEVLKGIPVEEVLKGIPVEDRFKGVPVEDRLKGLTQEEIEAYLHKLKKSRKKKSE